MSGLGPEWQPGPGGLPYREAARVCVLSPAGRLLLILGHDFAAPDRSWWFTPGGGRGPGESARACAARELAEETGLTPDPGDLIGPVVHREALFRFAAVTARQDEDFFLYRTLSEDVPGPAALTASERDVLDGMRWWDPADLRDAVAAGATVYPPELPDLAEGWIRDWDGTTTLLRALD